MDSSLLSPLTRRGKRELKDSSQGRIWLVIWSLPPPFPSLTFKQEKNVTLFSLLQHREKRKKTPLPSLSISRFPLFQLESTIHSTDK